MSRGPRLGPRLGLTKLGAMPPLAAAVLGGLSVLTADAWLLLLSGGALGLLVAAVVLKPRVTDLRASVELPRRAVVGESASCTIRVENVGERRTSMARLTHTLGGLVDVTILVPALAPGGSADVSVTRLVVARTVTTEGTLTFTSSEPLGLIERTAAHPLATDLIVHARQVPVQLGPLAAAQTGEGTPVPARSGLDVHGVREWQPGDTANQVHWRSTARRGRLVVLERETRLGTGFAMVVVGPADQPSWEPLVALVGSTAVAAARAGRRVTLYAAQPDLAELTSIDRTGLLDWCSALDRPTLPPPALIARALRRVGPGGDLVVATTWVPPQWWAATTAAARQAGVQLQVLTSGAEHATAAGR